ncbi:DnaA ATPase domain-containing protein [Pararhodobacter oceanensis]|uniref:Chromosomal replication initiator DnaA n=1 Tax=Pararhodobacter oceanensis TaxID=2172121 RepID=A0A2T8HWI3_9RHOB|nr:DnaA/Hda family protein [Pararhodobacter oceanensis]PVH29773.1 chromosomal replication initiator DnaA [Pararhodobacter oceanensis]
MSDRIKPEQITFDLPNRPAMGREDFLEAPSNALALAAIESPAGLPAGIMVLTGPRGSGKTHLAHVWAQQSDAQWLDAATLPEDLPYILASDARAFVIDDAHLVSGAQGQEALFHLINHLRNKGSLLLTARQPVRDWGLTLPDLISRLSAAAHVALAEPDETLLAAVLVKLFNDRQLRVQPALITYLLGRMERSLAVAGDLVARLDAQALKLGRPVTRALAQELLAKEFGSDGDDLQDLDIPPE